MNHLLSHAGTSIELVLPEEAGRHPDRETRSCRSIKMAAEVRSRLG